METHLCFASVCYGGLAQARFMRSLLALRPACEARHVLLTLELWGGEALIGRARAGMVAKFLKSPATHLVFVDNEAAFEPQEVFDLIASGRGLAATPDDRLVLLARWAAQRLADAHPELHARLGDIRAADGEPVPMLFESLLTPAGDLHDLAALRARWRTLEASARV
jgi:hypothetical protein